ncbi:MAG: hypothetical protein ACOYXC_17395, partial [Candidatus Rifleibacteriota bacterium]
MSQATPSLCRILFIDIVGFSKKPSHDQKLLIQKLTEMVRTTPQIQQLEKSRRVELPTGDGIAIALWCDAWQTLDAAVELAKLIKLHNKACP